MHWKWWRWIYMEIFSFHIATKKHKAHLEITPAVWLIFWAIFSRRLSINYSIWKSSKRFIWFPRSLYIYAKCVIYQRHLRHLYFLCNELSTHTCLRIFICWEIASWVASQVWRFVRVRIDVSTTS
jgi:hypothetical protein